MPNRKTTRRWFRFSLRSLLIATMLIGVVAGWLTSEVRYVHDRWATFWRLDSVAELYKDGGGAQTAEAVLLDPCAFEYPLPDGYKPPWEGRPFAVVKSTGIPFWRRWLGDVSFALIKVPNHWAKSDALRLQALFPEALLYWQRQYWSPQALAALPDPPTTNAKSFLCAD